MVKLLKLCQIVVFSLLGLSFCAASTYFVDASAQGENNGNSWTNGFKSLKSALTLALPGDTVLVATGIYYPIQKDFEDLDRSSSFVIPSGVFLQGGYSSGGLKWNWKKYVTILSGDIDQNGTLEGNSYHVIYTEGLAESTFIEGFFIQSGNANGDYPHNSGGGWFNTTTNLMINSSPFIKNCHFSGNYAIQGSAMYNESSRPNDMVYPLLYNCFFQQNESTESGAIT